MAIKVSCIYAIVSPSGGAYIGSTQNKAERWRQHRRKMRKGIHANRIMNAVAAKYGVDALDFRVLELCEVPRLIEREQWWLDNHEFAKRYNLSGIAGRPEHTAEVRALISASSLGRRHTEETKRICGEAAKRATRTPEWIKSVADAQRGKVVSDDAKAKMSAAAKLRKRAPMRQETKDRIREAKKGKPMSDAHRASLSAAQLRRYERDGPNYKSEETKAKMSAAARLREQRKRDNTA